MKTLRIFLALLAASCVVAGCSGDDNAAKPIQPGDYTTAPGQKK